MRDLVLILLLINGLGGTLPALASPQDDLFKAAQFDDINAVTKLVKGGLDVNIADSKGNTALLLAIREKSMKTMDALLKYPDTDLEKQNKAGEDALMMLSLQGLLPQIKYLVEYRDVEINKTGWTALHYAASANQQEVVKFLLEKSAYIDAESPNGTTPLMMAVRGGHIHVVKLLLDEGADMRIKNQQGMDAIEFARRYNQKEIEEGLQARWRKLNQLKGW